ncbi:hypothetical protein ACJIZ3_017578 [Penstemon smallii]|uniref:Bifunctional inhibitor/plant lipid transfer protein/seed storage helical domain-containing protein n=1 Tax=Penstemon smallii TaxID=265156 RepID=A0ABD3SWQ1_9LAMI
MAHKQVSTCLALILAMTMLWSRNAAQSDCTNVIISMSPCLDYITGNTTRPSNPCCTQLGTVVRSQPQCLCQVLNGGGSNLGLNINQTQALELPRTCNVQTPPISQCNAVSPAGSPGSSPNSNTGSGSRTTPSSGDGASDATSNMLSVPVLFVLLSLASYVSTFNVV